MFFGEWWQAGGSQLQTDDNKLGNKTWSVPDFPEFVKQVGYVCYAL